MALMVYNIIEERKQRALVTLTGAYDVRNAAGHFYIFQKRKRKNIEQTTPKGATMLKVTGILMIIGGAISIIASILAIIGIAAIAYLSDGSASLGLLYASGALLIVSSVAELIAGILGTANCKKPEKAKTCLAWGIVVAVLAVAGIILNAIGGGSFSVISLITGLVLPVLYIIGAVQNKQ